MASRHLLYLTNHQLTAVTWSGGRALSLQTFPANRDGAARFAEYVGGYATTPTYLLLDLIEEDFRLDTIPRVGYRDRATVLARRLTQIYRNSPFRHASLQGQETEGRRDWRVLYTAITNADLVQPWVDALSAERVPLMGVYSAPLLVTRLVKALRPVASYCLIVSLHGVDGLRQNFVQDGFLKFSRMTPLSEVPRGKLAEFIGEEIRKTWQYLVSLNHFGADTTLQVVVLCTPDAEREYRSVLGDSRQIRYDYRDIGTVARNIGMRRTPSELNAAALFIHILGQRPPANHFAEPELLRYATLRTVRRVLWLVSATMLAGFGLTAAANLFEARELARKITLNEVESRRIRDAELQLRRSFPPMRVKPDQMTAAVAFYNAHVERVPRVGEFLGTLSSVLERFPQLELLRVQWATSMDARMRLSYSPPAQAGNSVHTTTGIPTGKAQTPSPPAGPTVPGYYQTAIVETRIPAFREDYRTALAVAQSFQAALAQWPRARVTPLAVPLDVGATAGMQGRVAAPDDTGKQVAEAIIAMEVDIAPATPPTAAPGPISARAEASR